MAPFRPAHATTNPLPLHAGKSILALCLRMSWCVTFGQARAE